MILGCVQEAPGPISNAFQKNRVALKIRVFPNTIMKQSRLFILQWQDDPIALEVGGISLNAGVTLDPGSAKRSLRIALRALILRP